MIVFGNPIKHKAKYKRTDGTTASSTLTCVNENDAEKILRSISELLFKELVSCEKLDDCEDCKLWL